MKRTVWLTLGFLAAVLALAALKLSIAMPAPVVETTTTGMNNSQDTLIKADKLDVSEVDKVPDKKVVRPIPIEITPRPAQPEAREKVTKIISRHWHEGYAKITKRTAHNRRIASTAKK
jgi:hypothetical protein